MWGLVLLMALSAAQDPIRIGVMTLLIARPRPMHNLLAYWLGLMATGFGAALAALFALRERSLTCLLRQLEFVLLGDVPGYTMTDGPYKADEIRLESSLGYYLTKARNVLVERMDQIGRAHV